MSQEDFFKREIDKLGKILAKVLDDLLNLKSSGNVSDEFESVNEVFQAELKVSLFSFIHIPDNELLLFLTQKNLSNSQLELIAGILTELAEDAKSERSVFYRKALIIYSHITESEKDYSVERRIKMEYIKGRITDSDK